MSDPVMDGFDAYLDDQEQRAATDILNEVEAYVRGLEVRIETLYAESKRHAERASKGGTGSRTLAEFARIDRSNAFVITKIMLDLKKLLDIQEED